MFKKFLSLAIIVIVCLSMAITMTGCPDNKSNTRDENTILLWAGGQWTGTDAENLEEFIDWYNKNNTQGLTIELEIVVDFEQTFAAAMNTNKGPDLMIWDRFNTPSYAYDEVLLPLDEYISRDGIDASKFNSTAYNEMNYKEVQYGLPLDLDMWGVYVNMNIVDAYNDQHPEDPITCFWNEDGSNRLDWTWDELLDTATKLKGINYTVAGSNVEVKSGFDGKDVNEFFYHNYVSTGKQFFVDGKTSVNNSYGEELLTYFHNLYNNTYTEGYVSEMAFVQGQLAMYYRPTYFISYLEKFAGNMNVRYMPQPRYPGEGGVNCGVLGGYGLAIPKPIHEKNRDEAWNAKVERCWDFIQDWVYNEQNMIKWSEISSTVPALKSTHTHEVITGNKVLRDTVPFAETYTTRPSVPGWKDVQVNVFNSYVTSFCKGANTAEARQKFLNTIEEQTDKLLSVYLK